MKSKLALFIAAILMIGFATTQIKPAKAYTTRIYVNMEGAPYIPGLPVGEYLIARLDVDMDPAVDLTINGMAAWSVWVTVDPAVLLPTAYYGATGTSTSGYYLYRFVRQNALGSAYYPKIIADMSQAADGKINDMAEAITSYLTLGKGAGYPSTEKYGMAYGLVQLEFEVKSNTTYTPIHLYNALWYDATGAQHPFDIVEDGHYNAPPVVPEFPLGLASVMLMAPLIPVLYLWRIRKRKVR